MAFCWIGEHSGKPLNHFTRELHVFTKCLGTCDQLQKSLDPPGKVEVPAKLIIVGPGARRSLHRGHGRQIGFRQVRIHRPELETRHQNIVECLVC